MRRIVVFDNVSADGCFCDAEGGLGWVVDDPELMAKNGAAAASATGAMLLFGRRTYEMFAAFWPSVAADTPSPHGAGPMPPELLAMADMLNGAEKVVWSTTLRQPTWRGTRVLRRFDAAEVSAMKAAPGSDILVFGSGSIVAQLAEHGLVDEYILQVSPVVLGQGRSLFGGLDGPRPLRLLEATPAPSGVVRLRYAPA